MCCFVSPLYCDELNQSIAIRTNSARILFARFRSFGLNSVCKLEQIAQCLFFEKLLVSNLKLYICLCKSILVRCAVNQNM